MKGLGASAYSTNECVSWCRPNGTDNWSHIAFNLGSFEQLNVHFDEWSKTDNDHSGTIARQAVQARNANISTLNYSIEVSDESPRSDLVKLSVGKVVTYNAATQLRKHSNSSMVNTEEGYVNNADLS